jgi:hypothetical protein
MDIDIEAVRRHLTCAIEALDAAQNFSRLGAPDRTKLVLAYSWIRWAADEAEELAYPAERRAA